MPRVGGVCSIDSSFNPRLESSAHASNPPATHKASPDPTSPGACPQTLWKKIVLFCDPALTPLLGNHSSFSYLIGAQVHCHCACVRPTMEESEPERKVGLRFGPREGVRAGGGAAADSGLRSGHARTRRLRVGSVPRTKMRTTRTTYPMCRCGNAGNYW